MRELLEQEIKALISSQKDEIVEINPNLLKYLNEEELINIRDSLLDKKNSFRETNKEWLENLYETTKKN